MINFKFDDQYSMIKQDQLFKLNDRIIKINKSFRDKSALGAIMTGWADTIENLSLNDINDIKSFAAQWHNKIDTLVVCGIGGSYLGSRAINDLINSDNHAINVMWFGYSFSGDYINRCLKKLQEPNHRFTCIIISKSGTTLETLLGFRLLRSILFNQHGYKKAHQHMCFVTNLHDGVLHEYSVKHHVKEFDFPDNIGGRFSVISACGLLPLAILGVDIDKFIAGFQHAEKKYKKLHDLDSDCYKYAALRYLLSKKYETEILITYDEDSWYFAEWWKQLFAESEGKAHKGLMTNSSIFPFGLHSIGQFIQEGKKNFFETVVYAKKSNNPAFINFDQDNLDNLNYLKDIDFDDIKGAVFKGVLKAHGLIGKNPNLVITLDQFNAFSAGYLVHFFFLSVVMSCYLNNLNPFDQPGVEVYKKQVKDILLAQYKK